jgi:hypothetical protein
MGRSKGSRSISSIEYRMLCGSVLVEPILRLYPERVEIKKRWAVVTWANYFAQAAARRDFVGFGDDAVIGFLNQESAELTAPGRGPLPSPSRPHEDVLNVFVTRHAIDSCCNAAPLCTPSRRDRTADMAGYHSSTAHRSAMGTVTQISLRRRHH